MIFDLKGIIIICLIITLIYLNYDKIIRLYKKLKKEFSKTEEIEIKSDLSLVKKEQQIIQKAIKEDINNHIKDKKLKEVVMYSLDSGKKVRPIIVTTVYKKLGNTNDLPDYVMQAAIAIEYIHTASLIIDDIMDDDDYRRGKEALHIKYNLTIAQLAAVLLFSIGTSNIFNSLANVSRVYPDANKNITLIVGSLFSNLLKELTTGQYLDVEVPTDLPTIGDMLKTNMELNKLKDTVEDMIHKKTSSLFEYSFIIPWILLNYNKSDNEINEGIKKMTGLARHFGLIFQISDDFEDVEQDRSRDGKNVAMNYVINRGYDDAFIDYKKLIMEFNDASTKEGVLTSEIEEVIAYLTKKVDVYMHEHLISNGQTIY